MQRRWRDGSECCRVAALNSSTKMRVHPRHPASRYRIAHVALDASGTQPTNHTVFASGWLQELDQSVWGRCDMS